ncbi:Site-specific DNA recombinase [Geodermatophilus amargosae]|uniref:Site-specific DNA recombinase n=1 Tax=Geodermatophilus amargosae TaxID=1296565 RepID=A0A1I7D6C7_9ACTN|nr:recombinase family protein [Geodermatophilus amargosae]SFU07189.1 Site-specific DNA recombinase [Geodermatophilus amargosae]
MTAMLSRAGRTIAPEVAPLRAVIYTRVSSDPNDRGRSVEEQGADCRRWVEREGWELAAVYTDNDRSASQYARKGRPDWQRLMEDLARGRIDVLVAWEISRTTRDRMVWAALVESCIERNVKLCIDGRLHDLADPDDAFHLDMASSLAVRESSVTRKRVLRAVRANADKGRPHGKLLYGYRRIYDDRTGELVEQVPDPVTAEVVREAARRVLGGETPYAVAQDYNRRGVPAPRGSERGWDLTQVKRLCINPGYAGKRVHQGKVVGDAAWPAIISEADHLQLVAKLGDPARRSQRDSAIKHLLSGIAVCGVCGGRMRVQKNRGFLAYLCVDGFHVSRREDDVDAYVTELTLRRLERPDLADLMASEPDADTAAALAEAARLRAKLDEWYVAGTQKDGPSPMAVARVEAELLPQIEAAEKRALPPFTSPLVSEVASSEARDRWEKLPITAKREVISTLMMIRIMPSTRGRRTFDPDSVTIEWRS